MVNEKIYKRKAARLLQYLKDTEYILRLDIKSELEHITFLQKTSKNLKSANNKLRSIRADSIDDYFSIERQTRRISEKSKSPIILHKKLALQVQSPKKIFEENFLEDNEKKSPSKKSKSPKGKKIRKRHQSLEILKKLEPKKLDEYNLINVENGEDSIGIKKDLKTTKKTFFEKNLNSKKKSPKEDVIEMNSKLVFNGKEILQNSQSVRYIGKVKKGKIRKENLGINLSREISKDTLIQQRKGMLTPDARLRIQLPRNSSGKKRNLRSFNSGKKTMFSQLLNKIQIREKDKDVFFKGKKILKEIEKDKGKGREVQNVRKRLDLESERNLPIPVVTGPYKKKKFRHSMKPFSPVKQQWGKNRKIETLQKRIDKNLQALNSLDKREKLRLLKKKAKIKKKNKKISNIFYEQNSKILRTNPEAYTVNVQPSFDQHHQASPNNLSNFIHKNISSNSSRNSGPLELDSLGLSNRKIKAEFKKGKVSKINKMINGIRYKKKGLSSTKGFNSQYFLSPRASYVDKPRRKTPRTKRGKRNFKGKQRLGIAYIQMRGRKSADPMMSKSPLEKKLEKREEILNMISAEMAKFEDSLIVNTNRSGTEGFWSSRKEDGSELKNPNAGLILP